MNNELKVTFKGNYVEAISNGEKDLKYARKVWGAITSLCKQKECYKVLGISKTTKGLSTMEAYSHKDLFKELGVDYNYQIAWVELNPEFVETAKFVETVLVNRGFPTKIFTSVEEAKEWLIGKERKD